MGFALYPGTAKRPNFCPPAVYFWSLAFPFFGCALSRPPRLQTWLWENSEWERQAEKSTHQQDKSFGLFRKCGKSVLAQGACPRQGGRDEGLSIAGVAE